MAEEKLAALITSAGARAGTDADLPVYSVTKHAGFVPSLEYFKKQVFSRDLKGYKLVEPGDFAYATIHLDEGSVGIAPERALISPMYTVFRIDHNRVDAGYLIRFLKSPRALAHYPLLGRGAVHRRMAISLEALGSLTIPLPPLDEQRRIAGTLDQADAIRAKRRQVLAHFDSLTQSIFHDMFGRDEATAEFGDVAEIQGGLQVSAKRAALPVEVPYLRVANAHRGRLDLAEVKTLRATEAEVDRTRLRKYDLLFVEGHANPLEVGRVAMWDGSVAGCVHQNHLIRGRIDKQRLLPVVALHWFNSVAGADHFRRAGRTTSGLNTISASTVRSAPIVLPDRGLQTQFADRVRQIEGTKSRLHAAVAADGELFASLQSRAFRGEL